ncbi:Rho-related GTP-binding protein RhoV [Exaiptasia diaphana]|nr:Rho-related GTP-binding protein RhoV [Exaiptasia diaphana]
MEDFIAGWFGGCAGVIVGQPMDTIKVRMQAMDATNSGKRHSFRKVFFNTIKHETVSGLFKGMAPPLTAVALQNAILFGVYGNTLKLFEAQPNGTYSPHHIAVAGSVAGLAQCLIIVPLDLVKIKLQMQTEAKRKQSLYKGPIDCIKKIYQVRGFKGYFQVSVEVDKRICTVEFCDTAGQEDFDSFRPLCYPSTDVFIVCFSVVSPTSFSNVSTKWIPEIREFNPKAPIILVGTHSDLKNCMKVLLELSEKGESPISLKRAQGLVKKTRCVCYVETSSVTQKNLKTAFDEAISSGILPPKTSKTIDLRGCVCGVM